MRLLAQGSKSSRFRPCRSWSALDPPLFKQFVPATDRVVIQQKCIGDFLTAPPVIQKHQGVCPSRHPRRRRAIARQRDQLAAIFFGEESATNHVPSRIRLTEQCKEFLPSLQ